MEIVPIRNDRGHERALRQTAKLWGARRGTSAARTLEVLLTLVDDYESRTDPIDPPDPIEAIRFRMDQQGLSRRDMEKMIGSRARVSEVLSGRRPLTVAMIRRLRDGLGISADVLIGPGPSRAA